MKEILVPVDSLRWNNKVSQNLTLAVMLVVFLCQFFPSRLAISIEYVGDTHPLGHEINHQHNDHKGHSNDRHDTRHSDVGHVEPKGVDVQLSHDLHLADSPHLQESEHSQSLLSTPGELLAHEQAEHDLNEHELNEHEHSTHAHSFCHPPMENEFIIGDFQAETIALVMAKYQPLSHAPLLRPPHV